MTLFEPFQSEEKRVWTYFFVIFGLVASVANEPQWLIISHLLF